MLQYISIFTAACIILAIRFLNTNNKLPIAGIYQQRNKYFCLKYVFMFVLLFLAQAVRYIKRRLKVELGHSDDGTIHIHEDEVKLEKTHFVGDYPLGVDAVYFNGISKAGEAVLCGIARRPKGVCDAFFFLKAKDTELYLTPKHPDTYLQQSELEQGHYKVEGIAAENLVPMRTWRINYSGKLRSRTNPEETVNVEASLTWSAIFPPFNYDSISPFTMAEDMARETWSTDYFNQLKRLHQTHYEQMGMIDGTAVIDGKEHVISMPCVRDHSTSRHRDWRNFHRYVYHFIFLENGDCVAVGCASQPSVFSHLTIGYYCRKSDQSVWPVTSSDFLLYQHAEHQILPKDYGFVFTAARNSYPVQVLVDDEEVFYIGKDREAKFYERWCQVEVNGVKGRACVEWYYNNDKK